MNKTTLLAISLLAIISSGSLAQQFPEERQPLPASGFEVDSIEAGKRQYEILFIGGYASPISPSEFDADHRSGAALSLGLVFAPAVFGMTEGLATFATVEVGYSHFRLDGEGSVATRIKDEPGVFIDGGGLNWWRLALTGGFGPSLSDGQFLPHLLVGGAAGVMASEDLEIRGRESGSDETIEGTNDLAAGGLLGLGITVKPGQRLSVYAQSYFSFLYVGESDRLEVEEYPEPYIRQEREVTTALTLRIGLSYSIRSK